MQSIPAAEIMKACEGMLRKQLYVVFTTPTKGMEPVSNSVMMRLVTPAARSQRDCYFGAPDSIGTMAASLELRSVSEVLTLRTLGAAVSRSTKA
jgi:hypothetical protein